MTAAATSKNILDRLIVNSDMALAKPVVSLDELPMVITVTMVPTGASSASSAAGGGVSLILDATPEEQAVSVAAVHVAVTTRRPARSGRRLEVGIGVGARASAAHRGPNGPRCGGRRQSELPVTAPARCCCGSSSRSRSRQRKQPWFTFARAIFDSVRSGRRTNLV